ncbi:phospholipid carrier-dependent glycosyltransferase [Novosphingobium terrae]|uniref:phospholipid carrier-dependent glycosyltransferase n=1 Tax=Novosphingobium terrae TaxID=2726189 RepID=UPI00197FF9A4|nr:phospholipid carrier-dependent glycosyltransferase [Novosphingobium terrae]
MNRLPIPAPVITRDPLWWQVGLTGLFAVLVFWRLGIPSKLYFDEVHYVPAARAMLEGVQANPEHPLFAKSLIAWSIGWWGDTPFVWRLPSALMGVLGLFAFGRMMWWASGQRFAAIAGMVLLGSDFAWLIQSRIAMLDMVMAGMAMLALWMLAAATALPRAVPPIARRWRLGVAGVALGLSLGAKWSALPLVALIIGVLIATRLLASVRNWTGGTMVAPTPGVPTKELLGWLLVMPLVAYILTWVPGMLWHKDPVPVFGLIDWHLEMARLQSSVVKHHPYQSVWWQWVIDQRAIWYLYEPVDGAQRGVMLIGNPFTMLAGLPALGWCLYAGMARRDAAGRTAPLMAVAAYIGTLSLWLVANKPVQFYYHYLLPGTFLVAALALMLDALWRSGRDGRWAALGALVLAVGTCLYFWPLLTAAPLKDAMSFQHWMWLDSWR